MAITRGATITNIFNVEEDFTSAVECYVTYNQNGRTVLEKDIDEVTIEADKISVDMTQEDTLRFIENRPVEIQIRIKMADQAALVSRIIRTTASELLKEGVI